MPQSRLRSLIQQMQANTLSETEMAELRSLLRERARYDFEVCPACGGAFSAAIKFDDPMYCPNCETQLFAWTSDLTGHDASEVDPSLPKDQLLGVFSAGYSFPGVIACTQCGTLYPKSYSCCPDLIRSAVDYFSNGDTTERAAAIAFLETHHETFLNVLRSRFLELFTAEQIAMLDRVAALMKRAPEFVRVLEEIRARS